MRIEQSFKFGGQLAVGEVTRHDFFPYRALVFRSCHRGASAQRRVVAGGGIIPLQLRIRGSGDVLYRAIGGKCRERGPTLPCIRG